MLRHKRTMQSLIPSPRASHRRWATDRRWASLLIPLVLSGCPDPTSVAEAPEPALPAAPLQMVGVPPPPEQGGNPDPTMGSGLPSGVPGAPAPGTAAGGTSGGRPKAAGFTIQPGEGVRLSGRVKYHGSRTGVLRIDVLKNNETTTFPELLETISLTSAGPWTTEVPKDLGEISIVSFIDADDNGPNDGEPAAMIEHTVVASKNISGLDLTLTDSPNLGALKPGGSVPPPPPGEETVAPPGSAPPPRAEPAPTPPK